MKSRAIELCTWASKELHLSDSLATWWNRFMQLFHNIPLYFKGLLPFITLEVFVHLNSYHG